MKPAKVAIAAVSTGLTRAMALGATAWLGILFSLSGADYATRGWW